MVEDKDSSQSSSEKKKTVEVTDKVTISESVYVKVERELDRVNKLQEEAKKLQEEAEDFKKRAEVIESEVKKDEEAIKEIRRRYNIK